MNQNRTAPSNKLNQESSRYHLVICERKQRIKSYGHNPLQQIYVTAWTSLPSCCATTYVYIFSFGDNPFMI